MAIKHTVRIDGKGNFGEKTLTARKAIIHHCKECLGFAIDTRNCTSVLCTLYPFRTWDTPKSDAAN